MERVGAARVGVGRVVLSGSDAAGVDRAAARFGSSRPLSSSAAAPPPIRSTAVTTPATISPGDSGSRGGFGGRGGVGACGGGVGAISATGGGGGAAGYFGLRSRARRLQVRAEQHGRIERRRRGRESVVGDEPRSLGRLRRRRRGRSRQRRWSSRRHRRGRGNAGLRHHRRARPDRFIRGSPRGRRARRAERGQRMRRRGLARNGGWRRLGRVAARAAEPGVGSEQRRAALTRVHVGQRRRCGPAKAVPARTTSCRPRRDGHPAGRAEAGGHYAKPPGRSRQSAVADNLTAPRSVPSLTATTALGRAELRIGIECRSRDRVDR